MKYVSVTLLAALATTGCDANQRAHADSAGASTTSQSAADNTKRNERDRSATSLTPEDQGGSETDRVITQQVRQGVVGRDGLSMTAKNVKIVTVDGVVTLRGPVDNEQEQSAIGTIATGVAGVKRVDNQLEVASR